MAEPFGESAGERPPRPIVGVVGLVLSLAVIGLVTLTPALPTSEKLFIWSLARSPEDIAEAVLNVALFAPLGAALALLPRVARRPVRWALVGGALLSTAIEMLQLFVIPGRFGQLQDILANATGAAIGALVTAVLASRPSDR